MAVGVAAITLVVYLLTLAPGLTFENNGVDGGDLIAAASTLGVPHPPGYPTYTLLAWLATRIPLGTIAYRVNLFSAVSASLAAGLVCLNAQILLAGVRRAELVSAAGALTLAFSALYWSQAVIAEVYALLGLSAALVIWLLLRWRSGGTNRCLWLAGLTMGVGLGNHLTLIFAAPAALVLLWSERKQWLRALACIPTAALFFMGLGVYAYLPLAARLNPPVNWGNPQTWKGFLWVVTAKQYQQFAFGLSPSEFPARLADWGLRLGDQFIWVGFCFALVGLVWWWRKDRYFALSSLIWITPLFVYAFFYDTGDSHVYWIPAMLLLSIWWGGGACYLLQLARDATARPTTAKKPDRRKSSAATIRDQDWERLALVIILVLPLASMLLHWHQVDLHDDWFAQAYAIQTLDGVEPGSLVVVRGDRATFALWYGLYAEKYRQDVSVVSGPLLAFIWYRTHIRQQYPGLHLGEPGAADQATTDDLVRDLIVQNSADRAVYASDPSDTWRSWFDFVEQDAPIYRVVPKVGGE